MKTNLSEMHPDAYAILESDLGHDSKMRMLWARKNHGFIRKKAGEISHIDDFTSGPKPMIMYVNNRAWSKALMHEAYPEIALASASRKKRRKLGVGRK